MMSDLADRIKRVLAEQGIRQAELAAALGVSPNYISLLTTGKKQNISLTFAKLVESLYGYSAAWMLTGDSSIYTARENMRKQAIDRILDMNEEELKALKQFMDENL